MEESLKIMNMHLSMINKAYITLLQPLKPPSRMKLWKGKIGVYNKWSELSYLGKSCKYNLLCPEQSL